MNKRQNLLIAVLFAFILILCSCGDNNESRDYALTGQEQVTTETPVQDNNSEDRQTISYIGNKNSKKFHIPTCHSVSQMKERNKEPLSCTCEEAINKGYSPCERCIKK